MFVDKFIGMYFNSFATLVPEPLHYIYVVIFRLFFFSDYNLGWKTNFSDDDYRIRSGKFCDYVTVIQVLLLGLCNYQLDCFSVFIVTTAAAINVSCGTQIGCNWENRV